MFHHCLRSLIRQKMRILIGAIRSCHDSGISSQKVSINLSQSGQYNKHHSRSYSLALACRSRVFSMVCQFQLILNAQGLPKLHTVPKSKLFERDIKHSFLIFVEFTRKLHPGVTQIRKNRNLCLVPFEGGAVSEKTRIARKED